MFDATTLFSTWPMWLVVVLGVWSLVWKGLALWKCGRHNQMAWFIVILIFNTLGILPIIYLLFFQKKSKVKKVKTKTKTKKRKKR